MLKEGVTKKKIKGFREKLLEKSKEATRESQSVSYMSVHSKPKFIKKGSIQAYSKNQKFKLMGQTSI